MGVRKEQANTDKMGEAMADIVLKSIESTIYADNVFDQFNKGLRISSTAEGMGAYYQRVLGQSHG